MYNVVLISVVQPSDSVIHIYTFFFIFFSIMVYHRMLNIVPCSAACLCTWSTARWSSALRACRQHLVREGCLPPLQGLRRSQTFGCLRCTAQQGCCDFGDRGRLFLPGLFLFISRGLGDGGSLHCRAGAVARWEKYETWPSPSALGERTRTCWPKNVCYEKHCLKPGTDFPRCHQWAVFLLSASTAPDPDWSLPGSHPLFSVKPQSLPVPQRPLPAPGIPGRQM